jgi:hypothetical protein
MFILQKALNDDADAQMLEEDDDAEEEVPEAREV